jgi:hypothetical protein
MGKPLAVRVWKDTRKEGEGRKPSRLVAEGCQVPWLRNIRNIRQQVMIDRIGCLKTPGKLRKEGFLL